MPKPFHSTRLALAVALALTGLSAQAAIADFTTYKIRSVSSQQLVDVAGQNPADQTQVGQYPENYQPNQNWLFELTDAETGEYKLVSSIKNGGVLDFIWNAGLQRNVAVERNRSNDDSQRWRFVAVDENKGIFEIVNRKTGDCLDVPGATQAAAQLHVYPCNHQPNQRWQVSNLAKGALSLPRLLTSVDSKLAIDISGSVAGKVQQYTPHSGANQVWQLLKTNAAGDTALIYNPDAKQVIDIQNGSVNNDAKTISTSISSQQYDQVWNIAKQADGSVVFKNTTSGKCLDVPNVSKAIETQLIQYACNGQNNQKWMIVALSGAASTTPTSAPPPIAAGSKRGVGGWYFNGIDKALKDAHFAWVYDWGIDPPTGNVPAGTEFVPMVWGKDDVTTDNMNKVKNSGTKALLTFNEPDGAGVGYQSNVPVATALQLWPTLMNTGVQLGAPATAGNPVNNQWMRDFMSGAQARGYRVDFMPVHFYSSNWNVGQAVQELKDFLNSVHDTYHLDLWLTEYSLANYGTNPWSYPSPDVQADFAKQSRVMMDALPFVKRYAWFALEKYSISENRNNQWGGDTASLYNDDGSPTVVGNAYKN